MEEALGRFLTPQEVVHHKNGIVNDDRLENLEMMNYVHHNRLHAHDLFHKGKWSRKHDRCVDCGTDEKKHRGNGRCATCAERRRIR